MGMFYKAARLYRTLKRLKAEQWFYRAWHPLKRLVYLENKGAPLEFCNSARSFRLNNENHLAVGHTVSLSRFAFSFLNIEHDFKSKKIDWELPNYGLLWTFHLNYFDWLEDEDLDTAQALDILKIYESSYATLKVAKHSYPTSRRLSNLINFAGRTGEMEPFFYRLVYKDADRLSAFPEYHLMGNHLWENACSLLTAGLFFKKDKWILQGENLLCKCISTQLLDDGGHFEQSPSYHALLLKSLLITIEVSTARGGLISLETLSILKDAAGKMVSWLEQISVENDVLPPFNDVAPENLPTISAFKTAASALRISRPKLKLSKSGFRKIIAGDFVLFTDVGNVQARYQPGHSHSDPMHFLLYDQGKPIVTEAGTSTYTEGYRRNYERGNASHNTISLECGNSYEVWKSFRIGNSLSVTIADEQENSIAALGSIKKYAITRTLTLASDSLTIEDEAISKAELFTSHLHLAFPIRKAKETADGILVGNYHIRYSNVQTITLRAENTASGFNRFDESTVVEVTFYHKLTTTIQREF